ncbi:DNA-binding response regulator [Spirochaetia bacterium]|nr:DNA-binding response regulator [Spirochaetia bacterium]
MYQVVIVDDEPLVLEGLAQGIDWGGCGFELALCATRSIQALEYIRHNQVHLLISDVSMPEMNGLELIRLCKETNPLLSILVISAYDKFDYVREALRCGVENYLLKPIDPDELHESLGQVTRHLEAHGGSASGKNDADISGALAGKNQNPMSSCVRAVINAVRELCNKNISLKTLAAKFNVSPSYLGNAFKTQTGYYFNEYLTEVRLKYAANLLETTDLRMKEIVEQVGFSSQTYFNRVFKRRFSLSPVQYQRQKRTAPPFGGA